MQKSQAEMQKSQAEVQRSLAGMGANLNRAARIISALADITGRNEKRLDLHESRLRALEQRALH